MRFACHWDKVDALAAFRQDGGGAVRAWIGDAFTLEHGELAGAG